MRAVGITDPKADRAYLSIPEQIQLQIYTGLVYVYECQ
jgi:hypothetical protein